MSEDIRISVSAVDDGRTYMSVDEHFEGARFNAGTCIMHGHLKS